MALSIIDYAARLTEQEYLNGRRQMAANAGLEPAEFQARVETVRTHLMALAEAPSQPPHAPQKFRKKDRDESGLSGQRATPAPGRPDSPAPSRDSSGQTANPAPHFELVEAGIGPTPGVYWCDVVRDRGTITGQASPEWICGRLRVTAMTRDAQNGEWGRLLVFQDADANEHRWTCPQSMHAGNGDELRSMLLREGLTITANPRLRRMVGDYIQSESPNVRARCVSRTGWHGDVYVLPRQTFGDTEAAPVLFQAATIDSISLAQGGTLEGWLNNVSAPCVGNSRLVFVICMGFAGPCLGLVDDDGGGIHLRGSSSTGKTTALRISASVYGPPSYAGTWRATDNGLEGVAAMHSDMLVILDELSQLEPRHAGQVAYLLANGQGKSRSHRDGSPRLPARWRVLFLSAGEIGLADLVAESGGRARAGQEVRVIDLAADAGAGLGLFDRVPDGVAPGVFADALRRACGTHYGHALPTFLKVLVANPGRAREILRALRSSIADKLAPHDASGQVQRVANRFALVAAAGELATAYKLTGWETGEAERAAQVCFRAWFEARGTAGNAEPVAMLSQVRAFLEVNGDARFSRWGAADSARTINRAGFRKDSAAGPTYFVERECFRREVCQGFDPQAVARALANTGALQTDGRNFSCKPLLPDGRRTRVYVILPALWGDE